MRYRVTLRRFIKEREAHIKLQRDDATEVGDWQLLLWGVISNILNRKKHCDFIINNIVLSTDGTSGVVMKDKATYAGVFDCLCVDIYMTRNMWVLESKDLTLPSVCRDPQRQRHLRRWRILLLLWLLLLVVEVAAGPPPPLAAPAGPPVRAHRTGWETFCQYSWDAGQRKHLRVAILEPIKCGFGLSQLSEYYFTVLLRAGGQ